MRRIFLAIALWPALQAQTDWPTWGHDSGAQRFSPLKQITGANVAKLKPAWTFQMQKEGQAFRSSQSTPLVIGRTMYLSWPLNHVAALDADTGKVLWEFTARGDYRGNGLGSMRGLAYWEPGKQILFGTEDGELYSLNAATGKPSPGFGKEGVVNLKTPEIMNGLPTLHYGMTSAPFIYKDLVITGSHIVDETGSKSPSGDVRAWDVRTGKLVWTFHTIPRPGETGHDSWQGDDWKGVGGANVWTFFTLDAARGILYMPLGSANNDFYGTDRPGSNLFANCLVAVDAATGKLKWYFQAIHHDIWDYDLPVPPMLFDVKQNGKVIPAVGVMSKDAMLYVFDRVTGRALYDIEERPVPKGDVPGEYYAPTQPFPVKPPPLARQSFNMSEIAKITPEHEAACRALLEANGGGRNRGPYTPPSAEGTLIFPNLNGSATWSGASFDPTLGYYIINTTDSGGFRNIVRQDSDPGAPPESPRLFGRTRGLPNAIINGWPCWAPPWGRLTAVNVNTGEIAWQIPFGTMEGVPAGIRTGAPNNGGGPISTAGGITFIGATIDAMFRAFDSKTGKELWSSKLDEVAHSVPVTYQGVGGKQYVAVAAGAKLVVFALPD